MGSVGGTSIGSSKDLGVPGVADSSSRFFRTWRYNSPLVQVVLLGLICFCIPGMLNALNGLGAAGKADAKITDDANTALAVSFAVCSLLAGGVYNVIGHRLTLLFGGLAYSLYVGSYISYNPLFVISAGALVGVGAAFLWAAQGVIMLSYPEEENKGKYIGLFWGIFNTGAVLGSLIPLTIEWGSRGESSVSTATYVAFIVIMLTGSLLSLALLPPRKVVRGDGSPVSMLRASSWGTEAMEILKLFGDWRMITLSPMFLASNWFYPYQFNCVNGGGLFTTRTRALNGTLYWLAQILGSNLMGQFLDSTRPEVSGSQRTPALLGLTLLFLFGTFTWSGGLAFQLTFTRESVERWSEADRIDLGNLHRYAGPATLYGLYGLFDSMWQTYCYWIMGAITADSRKAARFVGFYKSVQNTGAALAGQVDAHKVSYLVQFVINWALVSVGCVATYVVAFWLPHKTSSGSTALHHEDWPLLLT